MMKRTLPLPWQLLPFLLFFLIIDQDDTLAQRPDSLKQHLADLLTAHQDHILSDTAYLKAVDSSAPLLVHEDSLDQLLSAYRQIAFNNKELAAYRGNYYANLALYNYNKNKYGSAIYYSEKNNEERTAAGIFEKNGIPRSELFAITVYYNNRDYDRVFAKYNSLRPLLEKIPAAIPSGKISSSQVFIAFSILNSVVYAAYKTKDTLLANEGIRRCEQMLEGTRQQGEKYKDLRVVYDFVYHTLCYARENYRDHFDQASRLLQQALREVRSPAFPPNYQPAYTEQFYAEVFDFYFDHGRIDSAQHYRDLLRSMEDSLVKFSSLEQTFLLESNSKLLAANGHFEAAYQELRKVYQMKDSSFYAVSADKDNNLYALAKEENTHNELLRSEAMKQKAEQFSNLFFFILVILAFGCVAALLIYRAEQVQRLLQLRLSLARNFHDEIGPMLLYANTLVKKEGETNPSPRIEELRAQLQQIMASVRGISHDLKSNEISTVQTFYKEIYGLLEKIKASTRIDFTARINNGSRALSHLQHTNLRKIVDELITNSIKHGECTLITIDIKATERHLLLHYSDNGKGLAPEPPTGGIGLQNIQERVQTVNGDFQLHNAWPEGYSIDISIPLV
ncbi:MAG TPA: ATP-binding protein [Puia sp.]|nr:ATP-binding protein [Puia sp.]